MSDPCDDFLDQLETFLDDECGPETRAKVEAHMKRCPPCEHRADFEERLRQIIASSCRDAAPSTLMASVRDRLQLG